MANEQQLEMLKRSVDEWNAWRRKHSGVQPDLRGADLYKAILSDADLIASDLTGAHLTHVNLSGADLSFADLGAADFSYSDLGGATFNNADLFDARLVETDLHRADLTGADFFSVLFDHTKLEGADFTEAQLNVTIFAGIDLSEVKGLETIIHHGPSTIGIDTIYKSRGEIPEKFLRGCGVPDTFIAFSKSLVGKAIEYYSCFISYSSQDEEFAKRLYADLQSNGVRCWFAPEDLKIGDRFRTRIDEAIRVHDKLLLVLSESSIRSDWVQTEVEAAFERERRDKRTVLFPVRLDATVMETEAAWAADIRRMRQIGDFTSWKQHDGYKLAFDRLMRDLKA